jgi:hypothetical protein
MKKKNLKSLRLKKSVVSNFKIVYGGAQAASDGPTTCQVCKVEPLTEARGCDLHTIGWDDAWYCFSWQSPDAWCGGR